MRGSDDERSGEAAAEISLPATEFPGRAAQSTIQSTIKDIQRRMHIAHTGLPQISMYMQRKNSQGTGYYPISRGAFTQVILRHPQEEVTEFPGYKPEVSTGT